MLLNMAWVCIAIVKAIFTKANFSLTKCMERANYMFGMAQSLRVIGLKTSFMAKADFLLAKIRLQPSIRSNILRCLIQLSFLKFKKLLAPSVMASQTGIYPSTLKTGMFSMDTS